MGIVVTTIQLWIEVKPAVQSKGSKKRLSIFCYNRSSFDWKFSVRSWSTPNPTRWNLFTCAYGEKVNGYEELPVYWKQKCDCPTLVRFYLVDLITSTGLSSTWINSIESTHAYQDINTGAMSISAHRCSLQLIYALCLVSVTHQQALRFVAFKLSPSRHLNIPLTTQYIPANGT